MKKIISLLSIWIAVSACSADNASSSKPGGPGNLPDSGQLEEGTDPESIAETVSYDATPETAPSENEKEKVEEIVPEVESPTVPIPDVAVVPVPDEEKISPPKQVTGAYLTAEILPREFEDEPLRIGLVGLKDEERMSDYPEKFESSWSLSLGQDTLLSVLLQKSKDPAYDEILEFYGNDEEFEALKSSIQINLSYTEVSGDSKLSDVFMSDLSSLLEP